MESFDRHIELNLHEASRGDPSHVSALVLVQQFSWSDVLSWCALEHSQEGGEGRTGNWTEDMDVASVRAWLRGDVGHTVATDDVSAQEVT